MYDKEIGHASLFMINYFVIKYVFNSVLAAIYLVLSTGLSGSIMWKL